MHHVFIEKMSHLNRLSIHLPSTGNWKICKSESELKSLVPRVYITDGNECIDLDWIQDIQLSVDKQVTRNSNTGSIEIIIPSLYKIDELTITKVLFKVNRS